MGAAACGGKGFKERGRGEWSEANRRRRLQTATRPGVMPPPPPPPGNMILQMHTPARSSQCWSRQTPAWTRSVHLDAPGQRHGQQPRLRDNRPPGVVKQDKSSGGSVDTTKTRSGPQRVRMSGGERPIGAAKGKQTDTEALCQPPPPGTRGREIEIAIHSHFFTIH